MKTKIIQISLGVFFLIGTTTAVSQTVRCTELIDYVKAEGRKVGEVSSLQLMSSSWLRQVTCYQVGDVLAVVAKIKSNDYDLYGKDYIFCGIPTSNWNAFKGNLYNIDTTYGERFHKYIFDYKCDCY